MKIYIFPEKHVVCLESLAIWIHMDTWMVEGHGESSHPNVFFSLRGLKLSPQIETQKFAYFREFSTFPCDKRT